VLQHWSLRNIRAVGGTLERETWYSAECSLTETGFYEPYGNKERKEKKKPTIKNRIVFRSEFFSISVNFLPPRLNLVLNQLTAIIPSRHSN